MKTAIVCTTFNRPSCLARSLPMIVAAAREVDAPVLVVDDGSDREYPDPAKAMTLADRVNGRQEPPSMHIANYGIYVHLRSDYENLRLIQMPENRGLAGALNIGLSYWLADPSIEAIHYIQDDVEVDPLAFAACNFILSRQLGTLVTGHDASEHKAHGEVVLGPEHGIIHVSRKSCRAAHMAMTRDSWISLMPIPSRGLGLPSKTIRDANHPERRGTGSGVDWFCCRDSAKKKSVICIPGLVRSFAWKREDSCWDNQQIAGEDAPLSRSSIQEWIDGK